MTIRTMTPSGVFLYRNDPRLALASSPSSSNFIVLSRPLSPIFHTYRSVPHRRYELCYPQRWCSRYNLHNSPKVQSSICPAESKLLILLTPLDELFYFTLFIGSRKRAKGIARGKGIASLRSTTHSNWGIPQIRLDFKMKFR